MKLSLICTVLSCLLLSLPSHATRADNRQEQQAERIAQGIDSGELTQREASKLIQQQRAIARTERRFKSDGNYTRKEKALIEHRQDAASAAIYTQKHDAQDRND